MVTLAFSPVELINGPLVRNERIISRKAAKNAQEIAASRKAAKKGKIVVSWPPANANCFNLCIHSNHKLKQQFLSSSLRLSVFV